MHQYLCTLYLFFLQRQMQTKVPPQEPVIFFLPMIFDHEVIIEFTQIAIIVQILNQQSIIVHNILV